MDKSAIKTYAVETRRKLIEAVMLKARQLYVFEDSDEYIKRGIDKTTIYSESAYSFSAIVYTRRHRKYGHLIFRFRLLQA